ncbi:MAG: B12-binding domain-containing radical SAM protein, partial [Synergistaceae bacterium]|nr:B12-binding domain-containing radical SAM protein [Synergistaceae bacterium]
MDVILCHLHRPLYESPHDYCGLFYLAACLERAGYSPHVYHGEPEGLFRHIDEIAPSAIGFGCDFDNVRTVEALSAQLAEHYRVPMIAGGPQSAGMGEEFLRAGGCGYILRGEAERTLPLLLDCVLRGEGDLGATPGLVWLDGGVYRENQPYIPEENLDSLPRPAYHCSLHKNRKYGGSVFTGRGCPHSCAFCASGAGASRPRFRSIQDVMDEIRENLDRRADIKYITVLDDTFTTSRGRVLDFCAGMREIRAARDVVWYCECHVGSMYGWRDVLPEMIDSGLIRLQIGVESGDPGTLRTYRKTSSVEQIEDFVSYAVSCGIAQIATNFIVGGPEEDSDTTPGFIRRLIQSAPAVIDVITGFLRPYPGTDIAREPEKFGLVLHDPAGAFAQDDFPSVSPSGVTQKDVVALRQRYNRLIRDTMKELIASGRLPMSAVMRQFDAAMRYGMRSRWFAEIEDNSLAYEYYYACYIGEGGNGAVDPNRTLPQRTFEFWRYVLESG